MFYFLLRLHTWRHANKLFWLPVVFMFVCKYSLTTSQVVAKLIIVQWKLKMEMVHLQNKSCAPALRVSKGATFILKVNRLNFQFVFHGFTTAQKVAGQYLQLSPPLLVKLQLQKYASNQWSHPTTAIKALESGL